MTTPDQCDLLIFRCTVEGKPRTQGSSRAFVVKGRAVITSDNVNLKPWRRAMHDAFDRERCQLCEACPQIADAARAPDPAQAWGAPAILFYGPVVVLSEFVLPRLAAHPKTAKGRVPGPPVTALDLDKLGRALHDSLKTAHVYYDDAQVVEIVSSKRYAALGEAPGVVVTVTTAETEAGRK